MVEVVVAMAVVTVIKVAGAMEMAAANSAVEAVLAEVVKSVVLMVAMVAKPLEMRQCTVRR